MILMLLVSVVSYAGKIHKAAKRGDVAELSRLIEQDKVDINAASYFSDLPLAVAILNNRVETVRLLVQKGADVNRVDIPKASLLVAEYLISKGARVDKQFQHRSKGVYLNPYIFTLLSGIFGYSFRFNIQRIFPSLSMSYGSLMLGSVASYSIMAFVLGGYKGTLLHKACEEGDVGLVRLLSYNGEQHNFRYHHKATMIRSPGYDRTPLHVTMASDIKDHCTDVEIARFLVSQGARKDLKSNTTLPPGGRTKFYWGLNTDIYPYECSSSKPYLKSFLLFGQCRQDNINRLCKKKWFYQTIETKEDGSTYLCRAVQLGSVEAVQKFLGEGANVNSLDNSSRTPLHWATALGFVRIVNKLLKNKARVNVADKYGKTALHNSTADCVSLLIDEKADVNSQDNNGWTPLHWAVHWADVDRVRELLKAGADPKIKNQKGQMPIWFIARDYKTFVPGAFTKPIVDLLKNPALAKKAVGPPSSTSSTEIESRATVTSTSTSQSIAESISEVEFDSNVERRNVRKIIL